MDTILIIDVGSFSVRLAKITDGKTEYKLVRSTGLAKGFSANGFLIEEAMALTENAILEFVTLAAKEGAKPYIFGTEALRKANNSELFCQRIYSQCGIEIEICDGDAEAKMGYYGAGGNKKQGLTVIDIGGASAEIICGVKEDITYCVSLPIGAVRLKDKCARDRQKSEVYVSEVISGLNSDIIKNCCAIGGTACSAAAIDLKLTEYDPKKVDGHYIPLQRLKEISDKLFSLSEEQIAENYCIEEKRAKVITGGVFLLYMIICRIGAEGVFVSESDNLEGYGLLKALY